MSRDFDFWILWLICFLFSIDLSSKLLTVLWLSDVLAIGLLSSGRPLVLYLLGRLLAHLSTSASHQPWLYDQQSAFPPSISFPSLHDLVDHQTSLLVCHKGTEHPSQLKKSENCKVWETKAALCFQDKISKNFVGYSKQQTKLDSFCLACFLKSHWWILCTLIRQSVPDHSYDF